MSRPFKLYRLQQLDSQIDWALARLREIETALKEDAILRQAMQLAEESTRSLQETRLALRQAEDNVRQQRLKIEQTEATLYGGRVRNPKELQDLQNDTAALKRHLVVLEDRQLEAMLAEEETSTHNLTATSDLEKARSRFDQQQNELTQEKTKLLKDVTHLEEERQAVLNSIQTEDLSLYNQLRQQRRGIAVAKVMDRACTACGSVLSAALLHAAHSSSQITRCETCSRILYVG